MPIYRTVYLKVRVQHPNGHPLPARPPIDHASLGLARALEHLKFDVAVPSGDGSQWVVRERSYGKDVRERGTL